MNSEIVVDIVKLVLPSVIAYLVWLTKSVLKQGHDLDSAFQKIRVLEDYHDDDKDKATCLSDCQRKEF